MEPNRHMSYTNLPEVNNNNMMNKSMSSKYYRLGFLCQWRITQQRVSRRCHRWIRAVFHSKNFETFAALFLFLDLVRLMLSEAWRRILGKRQTMEVLWVRAFCLVVDGEFSKGKQWRRRVKDWGVWVTGERRRKTEDWVEGGGFEGFGRDARWWKR